MPSFARAFSHFDIFSQWDSDHPGNAVRALFERWALPGEPSTSEQPLRLGLRDGYANFYVKGQSVAKLSCGREGPSLSLHQSYVAGLPRGSAPQPQKYEKFKAEALADPSTASRLEAWIAAAETYASAEKRFVDELIAANPGVIDLEMGLPASDLPGSPRVAPRMDLVIAQMLNGIPSIAFWEAKCANNPELRSSVPYAAFESGEFEGPKVINQVQKYVDWMRQSGRITEVQNAYKNTACLLLKFRDHFHDRKTAREPQCVSIWHSLSEEAPTLVVVKPGIVIGNYWPDGSSGSVASQRMPQCAARFATKHRGEIKRHGIHVHEVGSKWEGPTLPSLPSDEFAT